jgi:alpha-tubulin suppressor-like RCC1 family protein
MRTLFPRNDLGCGEIAVAWQAQDASGGAAPAITTTTSTIQSGSSARCRAEGTVNLPAMSESSEFIYLLQGIVTGGVGGDYRNQAQAALRVELPTVPAVPLSAGNEHTCSLTAAGGVLCWGSNFVGQLGDGSTTMRTAPTAVVGLSSGIRAVAADAGHTCVLTTVGGVKCWGWRWYGQLGDGTDHNSGLGSTSLAVVDVIGLSSGVKSLVAGRNFTCALTFTGGVKCWGNNDSGRLGDGTTTSRSTPVDVVGLTSGVQAIAAGDNHACAVTAAGGVKCWGINQRGQIGDGTHTMRTTPVDVVGLSSGVQSLTAGFGHTCALLTTGGVKCWGENGSGELGDGTTGDDQNQRPTPVAVASLSSGVRSVAAGDSHTCALTLGGDVLCWGWNERGQIGVGSLGGSFLTPTGVTGLSSPVKWLTVSGSHSCVLLATGGVKCWGFNGSGELGFGAVGASLPTPGDVPMPAPVLLP